MVTLRFPRSFRREMQTAPSAGCKRLPSGAVSADPQQPAEVFLVDEDGDPLAILVFDQDDFSEDLLEKAAKQVLDRLADERR